MAPLIDVVAGARPNFMKIAPILRALDARRAQGGPLRCRLIRRAAAIVSVTESFRENLVAAPKFSRDALAARMVEILATIGRR